ncbi:MAG: hypothetical protein NG712_05355 [Omnitrophica bacterium]|nr:hypothetical protein [Candidatus Omnitrophota bacterium]
MIKKDKLLSQLNKLVELEKSLIPLLNKHISSSLFFSNLEKSKRQSIVEHFQKLVIAKKSHIEILDGIKSEVDRREKDVY